MARSEFSPSTKVMAWNRCGGVCEGCGTKLFPGKYQYDHIKPDGLGGSPTLDNCAVLCTACHSEKTHKQDRPIMAKADRQRKAHIGATAKTSRPMPCGKNSREKKKLNGQVVDRRTGQPVYR